MTCELFRFPPCDCFFSCTPHNCCLLCKERAARLIKCLCTRRSCPSPLGVQELGGLQSSFNIPEPHCSQCDVLRTGAEHSCFLFPLTPLCCGFGLLPTGQIKTPLRGFAFLSHPCILQNRDLFNTDDALSYGMLGLDLPGLPAPHPTAPC